MMRLFMKSSEGTWPREQLKKMLFNKRWLQRVRLKQIISLLGPVDSQDCLDLVNDEVMSWHLRQSNALKGCRWNSIALHAGQLEELRLMVGERAQLIGEASLPFEDKTFDAIVVSDYLEFLESDEAFVQECHRVLKASGRLIVTVPRKKSWSLLRGLQELVGLVDKKRNPLPEGYTESRLFDALKDGFDVQESRTYSRFFVELYELFCQLISGYPPPFAAATPEASVQHLQRALRFYAVLYPLFWVAWLLDFALFFMQGNNFIVRAKRRMWVPRRTPRLRDGRSIAEAALQSKIGTAAPF